MAKLLDENGLAYFWGKVKAAISAKMDSTNPVGTGSFAMNMKSGATLGTNAHVEGTECEATTEANHAEGYHTSATGSYAHAEGRSTLAGGYASHAEGNSTAVNGKAAHVEGRSTVASGEYQHVQGKYNVEDTADTYAHIVGNGTADDARSNAHTLDWSGNAWFAGKVTVGAAPTEDLDVATKKYVDEKGSSGSSVGITGTLAAGETELVLSDSNITTDSTIDIYTNYYGVNPSAVTLATGSVTLTFAAMRSDIEVKVEVK